MMQRTEACSLNLSNVQQKHSLKSLDMLTSRWARIPCSAASAATAAVWALCSPPHVTCISIGLWESQLKHWVGIAVYHIHLPATPLNGRLQCMPLHALHVTVVTCKAAALSCRNC